MRIELPRVFVACAVALLLFVMCDILFSACGPVNDVHSMNGKMDQMVLDTHAMRLELESMVDAINLALKLLKQKAGVSPTNEETTVIQNLENVRNQLNHERENNESDSNI